MKLYYLATCFIFAIITCSQQTDNQLQEQMLAVVSTAKPLQALIGSYLYAWHFTKFCDVALLQDNLNCTLPRTIEQCTSYYSATENTHTQIDQKSEDLLKKDATGMIIWSAKKTRQKALWALQKSSKPLCFQYSKNKKYLACGYEDGSIDIFQDGTLAQELSINNTVLPGKNPVHACYFAHHNVLKAESHDHSLFAWHYYLKEFEAPIDISCAQITDVSCSTPTSATCTIL
jgi:hypothetical protein